MKLVKILFTVMLCTFIVNANAEEADATAKLLDETMTAFIQNNNIPGAAVELYVDGKLYEQYYGYADIDKNYPVIRKTVFEIGSISKVMTSILFAQEIDWAKMALNDPVSKYIKGLPASFDKITLQDLATHTSGLPFKPPANISTQDELMQYLSKRQPDRNTYWKYSNIGIGLLGYALANSTESDFNDLYRRHILNPLQMVNGVVIPPALVKYYAQGYDADNKPVQHDTSNLLPAAYAIKASPADMQKFLSAAIGLPDTPPRVFYPIKMTQSIFVKLNDNEYQGLGWNIHAIDSRSNIRSLLNYSDYAGLNPQKIQEILERAHYDGNHMMDKTGTTEGFRAYIAVIPNKKAGIVILVNKNIPGSAMVKTARGILFKSIKL